MHEGGFRIERDYRNRWFFKRPDGRAVPSCGYQPEDVIDDDIDNPSAEGFVGVEPIVKRRLEFDVEISTETCMPISVPRLNGTYLKA